MVALLAPFSVIAVIAVLASALVAAGPISARAAETILDFGAVCDGAADDRPAMTAMLEDRLEAALPAGRRCRLAGDLILERDHATVRCAPGATILLDGQFDEAGILVAGAADVKIEGCKFDLAGRTAVPAIATDHLCSLANGTCHGGENDGTPCLHPGLCPGGRCEIGPGAEGRCRGGTRSGRLCTAQSDCEGDGAFCEHRNSCLLQSGTDVLDNEIGNLPDAEIAVIRILPAAPAPTARTQGNRVLCPTEAVSAITGMRVSGGTTSDNTVRGCAIGIDAAPVNGAAFVSRNTVHVSGVREARSIGIRIADMPTSSSSVNDNLVQVSSNEGIGIESSGPPVIGNTALLGAKDAIGIAASGMVTSNVVRPAVGMRDGHGTGIAAMDRVGTISSNMIGGLAWGIVPRGGGVGNASTPGSGSFNKRIVGNEILSTRNGVVAVTGWHVIGNTINWMYPPGKDGDAALAAGIWIGDPRRSDFGDHACTDHSLISSNNVHSDREDVYLVAVTPVGMRCRDTNRACGAGDGGPEVCDDTGRGVCRRGERDGKTCGSSAECPKGKCIGACRGGKNDGAACLGDHECDGGTCHGDICEVVACRGINLVGNEFIRRRVGPASIDLGRGKTTNPIYADRETPLVDLVGVTSNMSITPEADALVAFGDDSSRYARGGIEIGENTTTAPETLGFREDYAKMPQAAR